MSAKTPVSRRSLLHSLTVGTAGTLLTGCDGLGRNRFFRELLRTGEWLNYRVQRMIGADALAREYSEDEISPEFRVNGNARANSPQWRRHLAEGFANFALEVDGLVASPQSISLTELRSMPSRSQITRHDCVEGWSAIGKWTGVPLAAVLERVGLRDGARYIVFHCADDFDGVSYYESIDLVDAFHPQTILAYTMNDAALPVGHGAPLRLRVERQLGYKHAKFVMRVEAVADLADIGQGEGGYWEDAGFYDWYAGI